MIAIKNLNEVQNIHDFIKYILYSNNKRLYRYAEDKGYFGIEDILDKKGDVKEIIAESLADIANDLKTYIYGENVYIEEQSKIYTEQQSFYKLCYEIIKECRKIHSISEISIGKAQKIIDDFCMNYKIKSVDYPFPLELIKLYEVLGPIERLKDNSERSIKIKNIFKTNPNLKRDFEKVNSEILLLKKYKFLDGEVDGFAGIQADDLKVEDNSSRLLFNDIIIITKYENIEYVLAHEVGHKIASKIDCDLKSSYEKIILYVNELDEINGEQQLYSRKAYKKDEDIAEEIFADWYAYEVMRKGGGENRVYNLIKQLEYKYPNIESELQEILNEIIKNNTIIKEFSLASINKDRIWSSNKLFSQSSEYEADEIELELDYWD